MEADRDEQMRERNRFERRVTKLEDELHEERHGPSLAGTHSKIEPLKRGSDAFYSHVESSSAPWLGSLGVQLARGPGSARKVGVGV
jgi:hypothetical protein